MLMWMFALSALAGEHKPLCDKIKEADLVIEVEFKQKAVYPTTHKDKEWEPPEEELVKTAKTGVVSKVFKGSIETGSPWNPAWGVRFDPGEPSVKEWEKFFALDQFKEIYFLRKSGDRFSTTGWAEESAGCGSSDHRSWCAGYAAYQQKVMACLQQ